MLAFFFVFLLILLVAMAALDLLLPRLAWRLHVWSKRTDGKDVEGLVRTRAWEVLRIVRGVMLLLLAGVLILFYAQQAEDPDPAAEPPYSFPSQVDPAQRPQAVFENMSTEERDALRKLAAPEELSEER